MFARQMPKQTNGGVSRVPVPTSTNIDLCVYVCLCELRPFLSTIFTYYNYSICVQGEGQPHTSYPCGRSGNRFEFCHCDLYFSMGHMDNVGYARALALGVWRCTRTRTRMCRRRFESLRQRTRMKGEIIYDHLFITAA